MSQKLKEVDQEIQRGVIYDSKAWGSRTGDPKRTYGHIPYAISRESFRKYVKRFQENL